MLLESIATRSVSERFPSFPSLTRFEVAHLPPLVTRSVSEDRTYDNPLASRKRLADASG